MDHKWANIGGNMSKFAARLFFCAKGPSNLFVVLVSETIGKQACRDNNAGHPREMKDFMSR